MTQSIDDLLTMMARLRDPESGCSWDLKQTFATIAPYTLEEACEVVDAIEQEDWGHLREELGDLLLQVIFHAQMGREAGYFDFSDVCQTLLEKMLRRHPHVFPDGTLDSSMENTPLTPEEVKQRWEEIKAEEKRAKQKKSSGSAMPDDLPAILPALKRAQKLQKAAAKVGFDWPGADPVYAKIEEEIAEIQEASEQYPEKVSEEIGDLLFACVNLARHLGVDADMALRQANGKFERRFRQMETLAAADDQTFQQLTLDEMEAYWQQSKTYDPAG